MNCHVVTHIPRKHVSTVSRNKFMEEIERDGSDVRPAQTMGDINSSASAI